jgi:hypothetical protein
MNKVKILLTSGLMLAVTALAHAQTDPMDASQAKLGTGVTAAGVLAGTVGALFAGIWVYKLVKKGGSKVAT